MYVDIVISNAFNLNIHFFSSYFLSLHQTLKSIAEDLLLKTVYPLQLLWFILTDQFIRS